MGRNPAAVADAGGAKSNSQRWSRAAVVVSLVISAFGMLSIFDNLLPNLVRLSLVFKALTSAYRLGREWLFEGIQSLALAMGLSFPELSPLWKDALVCGGLLFAALNFESVWRFKQSLVLSFFRDIVGLWATRFGGRLHQNPTIFDNGQGAPWISMILAAWISGFGIMSLAHGAGIGSPSFLAWAEPFSLAVESAVYGGALAAVIFVVATLEGDVSVPIRGPLDLLVRLLTLLLTTIPYMLTMALRSPLIGWRAIALSATLVVAFVGVNLLFDSVVDPLVRSPPHWLQDLIEADPNSLSHN